MRTSTLLLALFLVTAPAHSAELHILGTGTVQDVVPALAEEFGSEYELEISTVFGPMVMVRTRIEAEDPADIIIVSTAVMESFLASNAVMEESVVPIGHVGMGMAVREGAPIPRIASVDEFRSVILGAESLVHMDPAAGVSSGIAIARTFDELGIADQIADKTLLLSSGLAAERVASGEVEIAIQNMRQLMVVDGVEIVGPLPPEIQTQTNYVAGVAERSSNKDAAAAFIAYMTREDVGDDWRAIGMEPAIQ